MNKPFSDLLSISSEPIVGRLESEDKLRKWGPLGDELARMLSIKNGFYAFESALLVRPCQNALAPLGLEEWNSPNVWTDHYEEDLSTALFFAEDILGGQYCIRANGICSFDPETGVFETVNASLSEWASDIRRNYEFRTGYPLAHEWQMAHGPIAPGMRLLPKIPFVCGGKYKVHNLFASSDVDGMRFRASIANQIRDLPDGAVITFKGPRS